MVTSVYNIQYNVLNQFYEIYSSFPEDTREGGDPAGTVLAFNNVDTYTGRTAIFEGTFSIGPRGYSGTIHEYRMYDASGNLTHRLSDMNISTSDFGSLVNFNDGNPVVTSMGIYSGNDSIQGSDFSDTILGFEGNDTIFGSASGLVNDVGDVILGNNGSDVLYGGKGDDSMVGGSWLVDPADSADTIYGGDGNDDIYGSAGNDIIDGGNDNDLIVAGADDDTVTGGAGNDIFVHVLGGGYDTVTDFQQGDIVTIERTAAIRDFADVVAHSTSSSQGVFIDFGNSSGVTLLGVQLSTLDAGDFYLYG